MEELVVTIQEGDVKVEVEGVKGSRCLELTQAIEILLGETSSRQLKDDFYGQANVKQSSTLKHIFKNNPNPTK
jgi:hypothetical protein